MRRFVAVIFMVIFSFQVLPVRVLGKLLAKGQTQEDVKSSDSGDDANNAAKYLDFLFIHPHTFAPRVFFEKTTGFIVHKSDDLTASYVTEILSPPPNC